MKAPPDFWPGLAWLFIFGGLLAFTTWAGWSGWVDGEFDLSQWFMDACTAIGGR